jgi:hypothetical protein
MTGSISVGEFYTFLRKLIDIGRLVKAASETPHIGPAQAIHQKENYIRLCFRILS